jgi:hypothetical protein
MVSQLPVTKYQCKFPVTKTPGTLASLAYPVVR